MLQLSHATKKKDLKNDCIMQSDEIYIFLLLVLVERQTGNMSKKRTVSQRSPDRLKPAMLWLPGMHSNYSHTKTLHVDQSCCCYSAWIVL